MHPYKIGTFHYIPTIYPSTRVLASIIKEYSSINFIYFDILSFHTEFIYVCSGDEIKYFNLTKSNNIRIDTIESLSKSSCTIIKFCSPFVCLLIKLIPKKLIYIDEEYSQIKRIIKHANGIAVNQINTHRFQFRGK